MPSGRVTPSPKRQHLIKEIGTQAREAKATRPFLIFFDPTYDDRNDTLYCAER